jgi:hypothetical protein
VPSTGYVLGANALSTEQTRAVIVRLNDAGDLFVDPDPGADRYVSGIEELYCAVKINTRVLKRPDKYHVTIELPREKVTDRLTETISAKIKAYSQFKAEQSYQQLIVLRHQGLDSLRVSIAVLVPCAALWALCTWLLQTGIHSFLEAVFLVVAGACVLAVGWVALWMPAEYFLYDTWPFQQDMRVYKQIADAELVISPREDEAPIDDVLPPQEGKAGASA